MSFMKPSVLKKKNSQTIHQLILICANLDSTRIAKSILTSRQNQSQYFKTQD